MPPSNPPPFDPVDHLLPPGHAERKTPSIGPVVGVIIIVLLLIIGALYFWGAHLNAQKNANDTLPLIQGDASTSLQY